MKKFVLCLLLIGLVGCDSNRHRPTPEIVKYVDTVCDWKSFDIKAKYTPWPNTDWKSQTVIDVYCKNDNIIRTKYIVR